MKHPSAVTACNLDLENLITDSNRSIATLAITTLLKTGSESSVDRLMKQISSFVSEISDEFKVSKMSLQSVLSILMVLVYIYLCSKTVPVWCVQFLSGGGCAGHQCIVPKVSQEAQCDDELPVQHAQR